jgi:starvation-inducible DNA-binding protein
MEELELYRSQILSDFANLWVIGQSLYAIHWNLISPHFLAIHKWTNKAHSECLEYVDELAERIRGLNIIIPTSLDDLFKKKTIGEVTFPCSDLQCLTQLLGDVSTARSQLVNSQAYLSNDLGTQDILTQIEKFYAKLMWFIQAQGVLLPQVNEHEFRS